jgi:Tfp pilus assembly PilM family ATPase
MSLLTSLGNRTANFWRQAAAPPRGWIGVDVGSQTIKLAQVVQRNGRLHIAARWLVTLEGDPGLTQAALEGGSIAGLKADLAAARRMFTGSTCAATVSMDFTEMRSCEVPFGTRDEMWEMVREELIAAKDGVGDDCRFDFWETHGGGDGMARVTALAVAENAAARLAADLRSAGYACQVLDGLPCALARAVAMADGESNEPAAALDLGYGSPTLVITQQGKPVFSRVLRGCGGSHAILRTLEASLQLSRPECAQLLSRLAGASSNRVVKARASGIVLLLSNSVARLVEELHRTLAYVAQQFGSLRPARMWLFGGGAVVPDLGAHLGERLHLPVQAWRLDAGGDGEASDDALFGVAAALSTLAWEPPRCT